MNLFMIPPDEAAQMQ